MSVPKNFIIRCSNCRWAVLTTGLKDDLSQFHEIKSNCPTCHGKRKFRCLKCGSQAIMRRIKGNS